MQTMPGSLPKTIGKNKSAGIQEKNGQFQSVVPRNIRRLAQQRADSLPSRLLLSRERVEKEMPNAKLNQSGSKGLHIIIQTDMIYTH